MTPSAETIVVDRGLLKHLIAKGKIHASDVLKLSPDLKQVAAAMEGNERKNAVIEQATGDIAVHTKNLVPLYEFARDYSWLTDNTPPYLYVAMVEVERLLLARGAGES